MKIDSVCGMDLTNLDNLSEASYEGNTFYFCSRDCKNRFGGDPQKFLGKPLISLLNVRKTFELGTVEVKVLRGLSLHVWPGDFTAIIGASGSGKSTVLNMIGLLDRPTSGGIFLKNQDVSLLEDEQRASLRSTTFGFVFQQYNLIPWLTAYENVILPLIFGEKDVERDRLEAQFEKIGLKERVNHRPFELSGGEQQRVALLRALANEPAIILGDEPTGNLDSATGEKILKMLIDLNKVQKKTLVIVTHDADIAGKADQIIALKDGRMVRDHQVHREKYTG